MSDRSADRHIDTCMVRLPEKYRSLLRKISRRRKQPMTELVREAIDRLVKREAKRRKPARTSP